MTKGKIVLVPFPFDDLSAAKVRPAVSLTDPIGSHRHLVLAFISSQIPDVVIPTDLVLRTTDPDFAATGLRELRGPFAPHDDAEHLHDSTRTWFFICCFADRAQSTPNKAL